MKKILFLVLVAAILAGCNPGKVRNKTLSAEEKYSLPEKSFHGTFQADLSMDIPVKYDEEAVLEKLRNSIVENVLGEEYVQVDDEDLLPGFIENMRSAYIADNVSNVNNMYEDDMSYNLEYILKASNIRNDGTIYSYETNSYVYMGGAHGMLTLTYYNYDLNNGDIITEEDIFVAGSEEFLAGHIRKNLVSLSSGELIPEDEHGTIYCVTAPNGNFYVEDDGIVYVYNPYEIAPYAYGHTKAKLLFSDIKEVLTEHSPLSYLIDKPM